MRLQTPEIKWSFMPQVERMIVSEKKHIAHLKAIGSKSDYSEQLPSAIIDAECRLKKLEQILTDYKCYEVI